MTLLSFLFQKNKGGVCLWSLWVKSAPRVCTLGLNQAKGELVKAMCFSKNLMWWISVAKSVPLPAPFRGRIWWWNSSAWWVPWMFNTSHGAPVKGETKVQGDQEMTEKQQKEQAQPRILDVQEDASRLVRIWLCGHGRTTKLWIPVCP